MKVPAYQTIEEIIRDDAIGILEKSGRLPRLAYMVNPRDAAAMVARLGVVVCDRRGISQFEMHTEAGYVRIMVDVNHPTGATHRFVICKCGGLAMHMPGVDLCKACLGAQAMRPYAPGEKMTDRHPDSVIAQVVEETIAKLPGGGSFTFTTPWIKAGDLPCASHPRPVQNGVFRIEPDPPDLAQRKAARVAEHQRAEVERMAKEDALCIEPWMKPAPVAPELLAQRDRMMRESYERCGIPMAPAPRPDGFDQRQVDAARAALLAPAPPRYPRSR